MFFCILGGNGPVAGLPAAGESVLHFHRELTSNLFLYSAIVPHLSLQI